MRNIIFLTFIIFIVSCGGGVDSNSYEPIQQNNTPTNTQNNSQTSTQTETETETEEVIKANFGEVKFGEAKFE